MSESKAVESYNAFDSIRNRFGGARKASSDAPTDIGHQQKKVSSKRRYDPWSKAPPLIPLVEESDIVQVEQFVVRVFLIERGGAAFACTNGWS